MKAWWLPIAVATVLAINPKGQAAITGRIAAPARSEPTDTAGLARTTGSTGTPSNNAQGVLIETSSNLGSGIGAELLGDYKEAVSLLTRAIAEERDTMKLALAHRFRGLSYKHLGRRDEALRDFLEVIRLQPQLDLGYYNAGVIYNLQRRYKEAIDMMTRAINLQKDPRGLARRRSERGNAYFHLGDFKHAQADFVAALRVDKHDPDVLNNVAWFRATCPDAAFRNGKEAVELATLACTLDKWKDADEIDTLAAAYAEAGNFAEAERYQQRAMALLSEDEALRPKFRARLEQYRARQPVRQEIS
jgi:tetratricopeptide (TPR) repeat protein